MSALPTAAVPNNASLAYAVDEKTLSSGKKHLEHVPIEKAPTTVSGGVHLGPGREQADFPPNEVGARSAIAAEREAAVHQLSHTGTSAVGATSRGGNALVESGASGEVSVQSSVVTDTTQEVSTAAPTQIAALLSKLATTTTDVEEYSRRQTEAISREAGERIQRIIADTQVQQDALLKDASARSLEIEAEYGAKLKEFLQGLDASKASNLAALERDLSFRQQTLLSSAREDIDAVHQAATEAKIRAMSDANRHVNADVDRLTEQVRTLGEAEVERRLNMQTTTVITTTTKASPDPVLKSDSLEAPLNGDLRSGVVAGEPHTTTRI